MLSQLFSASRTTKRVTALSYDLIITPLTICLAIALRTGELSLINNKASLIAIGITTLITVAAFIKLGLYRAVLRYMASEAHIKLMSGILISAAALVASFYYAQITIPRSTPIIYALLAFSLLAGPRIMVRGVVQLLGSHNSKKQGNSCENVIIYGAGYTGYQLALALQSAHEYSPIAFVDDDPKLNKTTVKGIRVYLPDQLEKLKEQHSIDSVLLALGDIPRSERASIVKVMEKLALKVQTIPPIADIVSGKAKIEEIRNIEIEDLLGRDPVPPVTELLHKNITNKSVMVSGAGGSIGSELCRQILKLDPTILVLYELSEFSLYQIDQELQALILERGILIYPVLGSVQNRQHLEKVMQRFAIQTIYHAAAYKHVPLVEHNIIEGVKNNVLGTWLCAEAAIASKVETFVLISTDKAVRPTNIMGATKRTAELVLQGLAQRESDITFAMVRFGNVLGSSGSVVPLFKKQIEAGGPITVTHPDITRYFMTIPEAALLVIQAGAMSEHGDVFVLDMGKPIKIKSLAKKMITLSRLAEKDDQNPTGDISILYTGLRPGEKLYEELLIGDNVSGTDHSRIMRAQESCLDWQKTKELINNLKNSTENLNPESAKKLLLKAPTGYNSTEVIVDYLQSAVKENSIYK